MKRSRRRVEHAARATRGITCDTGLLIALERRKAPALALLRASRLSRARITIPAAVIAEWWRGTHKQLLEIGTIEPLTLALAREAGLLLARTGRNNAIDALVVASAAQRGDLVITDDPDDIRALAKLVAGVDVDVVG